MLPVYCGIIGDEGVGKTSTLLSYASSSFMEGPLPATFEDYTCNVMVDDHPYCLTLHDTSDTDPICDESVDVFILLYSISNKQSFDNIQTKWKPWLEKHYPHKPFILAGNKIDERDQVVSSISTSAGKRLGKAIGAICYQEYSAKTQEGLCVAFEKVITAFLARSRRRDQKKHKKHKNCTIL